MLPQARLAFRKGICTQPVEEAVEVEADAVDVLEPLAVLLAALRLGHATRCLWESSTLASSLRCRLPP